MTQPAEYFNWDYQSSILTTGLVMLPLMMMQGFDMYALLMVSQNKGYKEINAAWGNKMTQYAWSCMVGGNMTWNGVSLTVWAFSFIESAFFQQSMFWTFAVATGLTLINMIVIDVFYIVGGVSDGGDLGTNLYMAGIHTGITLGYQAIMYWGLGPQIASFYRWHDQDWWSFGDFLKNVDM